MFDSKVHLVRSDEFKEEDLSQVVNLLKQFNGPIPELQVLRPNLEEIYLRMIGELK